MVKPNSSDARVQVGTSGVTLDASVATWKSWCLGWLPKSVPLEKSIHVAVKRCFLWINSKEDGRLEVYLEVANFRKAPIILDDITFSSVQILGSFLQEHNLKPYQAQTTLHPMRVTTIPLNSPIRPLDLRRMLPVISGALGMWATPSQETSLQGELLCVLKGPRKAVPFHVASVSLQFSVAGDARAAPGA